MILVFGATGNVGRHVVRLLAEQGIPARAAVHTPSKAAAIAATGIEIVPADLAQPVTLDAALQGVERAFLVTSGAATQLEGNVLAAARRAGVQHVVRQSGSFLVGADATVLFDQRHYQAEQALEQSGLSWTHLHPSYFMQNVLIQGASGTLALPFADAPVNLVDTRDIAAVAVVALTQDGYAGHSYAITGPAAITFHEVAATLSAVTGRPFTYVPVSEKEFRQALLRRGLPEPIAAALAEEYALIGAGHPAFSAPTDTVPRLTGRPAISFEQFARDHAAALQA